MADHSSLLDIIHFVSNLVSSPAEPDVVVASLVERLARHLDPIRASISLQVKPGTSRPVFASTGDELKAKARLSFSKNLSVRGQTYGRFQIDIIEPGANLKALLATLEIAIQQLALYAEQRILEQTRHALGAELAKLDEELMTFKTIARASGIVAEANQVSVNQARRWLELEATRTGRSLSRLGDLLIIQNSAFGSPLPGDSRTPGPPAQSAPVKRLRGVFA